MHYFLASLLLVFLFPAFSPNSNAAPRTDCGKVVEPGQKIQNAINSPPANNIICVKPGTYKEVVKINKAGLTLTAYDPNDRPIIDGDTISNGVHNYELPKSSKEHYLDGSRVYNYNQLVEISQDNVTFSHFIVQHSRGDHIQILTSKGVKVHHVHTKYSMVANINVIGDGSPGDNSLSNENSFIEDNIFEHSSLYHLYCDPKDRNGFCNWPGSVCLKGVEGLTFRNNISRYSKGDGILIDCNWGRSNNNILEGNIVYDNWNSMFYLHATSETIMRDNIIFTTPSNPYKDSQPNSFGINIQAQETRSNEVRGTYGVSNTKIYNNLVWGLYKGMRFMTQAPGSYIRNVDIYNNTIVNSGGYGFTNTEGKLGGIFNDIIITSQHSQAPGKIENSRIRNNIFYHPYSKGQIPITINGSAQGFSFSNNLWSKKPDNVDISKDFMGNAQLQGKTGSGDFPVYTTPPTLDDLMELVHWFELRNSSSAINKALPVNYITTDYFGAKRPFGPAPDIGAHEFGGKPGPTNTPLPTQPTSQWDLNNDNTIDLFDFSEFILGFSFSDFDFIDLTSFISSL